MKKLLTILLLLLPILYIYFLNRHIELRFLISHLNNENINNQLMIKSDKYYFYSNLTLIAFITFIGIFIYVTTKKDKPEDDQDK